MNLTEFTLDKLHEECGVFGIYGHPEAARLTYLGLYALQHRGQESCGIVAASGPDLRLERAMGHVSEAIAQVLSQTEGAFSMLFLTPSEMIAIRDSRGFRPLALGRLGDAWVIASETCAFDLIDATYVRDVEPGEMIVIDADGLRSSHPLPQQKHSMCLFEHVY